MSSCYHPQFICMIEFLCYILLSNKLFTIPNKNPAPLGLYLYPCISSGSLHTKSHPAPFSGIYCTLCIERISSNVLAEGDSPPCIQNTWPYITADKGI